MLNPVLHNRRAGALLLAAGLVLAAVITTWHVWHEIFSYALEREEQSHSLLALPVAAWLAYVYRSRLRGVATGGSLVGLLLMLAGWALAALGFREGANVGIHVGALLIVVGAGWSVVGTRIAIRIWPALGALLFILPVPGRVRYAIANPLQEWSAAISQTLLQYAGVDVARFGNVLTINGVDVAVAEACNGMRMVSALAVITYAYVFTVPLRPAVRLGLLAASPVIALGVNVLRLIPTILVYGSYPSDVAHAFHDAAGWGVLLLAIAVLWGITGLLRWLELPIDRRSAGARPAAAGPSHAPAGNRFAAAAVAAGALLVCIASVGGFRPSRQEGADAYFTAIGNSVQQLPYRIGSAFAVERTSSPGVLEILNPTIMLQRSYVDVDGGPSFGLAVVHCGDVRDLVGHYPPVCYPSHGWTAVSDVPLSVKAGDVTVTARVYEFEREHDTRRIRTRVVSFFVLPDTSGGVVDNMETVTKASRRPGAAGLGGAHVLITMSGDVSAEATEQLARSVIEHLEPFIRTTTRGSAS